MSLLFLYLRKLINLFFPTECIVCGTKGPDLCSECIGNFKWPKPRKRAKKWITSLWNYRDEHVEQVVRYIKNRPNNRIASIVSETFSKTIVNRPKFPNGWIVVPLPISKKRFRERGYNQAELLAKPIAEQFGLRLETKLLVKTRHTKKQGTSKTIEERQQNPVGAFKVSEKISVRGKSIILVDDVTTTGSTLNEARAALITAGALRVLALTVAN